MTTGKRSGSGQEYVWPVWGTDAACARCGKVCRTIWLRGAPIALDPDTKRRSRGSSVAREHTCG
ncbi:MAG: hypothetical protein VW405_00230 [Rhodospirillaceae bacterium]